MKKYEEPVITEEETELMDVIAVSSGGSTSGGTSKSVFDLDWSDEK